MPIFAYQSLNSTASSHHGIGASNSRRFTRMTHETIAKKRDPWMLSMPTAQGVAPHVPVHGPANLVASAKEDFMKSGDHQDASFLGMVEGKARQTHQQLIRALGGCDILVYGELDSSHQEWSSMQQNAGDLFSTHAATMACNCFSVHTRNSNGHRLLGKGKGWIAIRSHNVNAVFVHVPNIKAKSTSLANEFYREINNKVMGAGGGPIDLVMGDTNQPREGFTKGVLKDVVGSVFANAHPGGDIQPHDAYQRNFGGTNSTGTEMYDVAVYNTETVRLKKMIYLSQCTPVFVKDEDGSRAAAVTDHMGIGVEVVK